MTEEIKVLTHALVESYNKYIKDFWDIELEQKENSEEFRPLEFVVHSWGDRNCELLGGKTPKEAIGEILPEEIDFDDIIYILEAFAVGTGYVTPDAITDLFFAVPEAAEEYILSVIDGMDLSINVDNIVSDEENKKFCIFMEAVGFTHRISSDKAKERLFRLFAECDTENRPINEILCGAMNNCGFIPEMIALIDNSEKIGEKEHFVLQELVHIENNEDVFRCLKACLKKDCDDIAMTVQIVSDCNDGRLIPLIRKIAKNYLKVVYASGHTPYDKSDVAEQFFLICNAVVRLGGTIEDLLSGE